MSPDGEETTLALTGQLTLPAGFDSFADADLLAAVGGTPFADELAASGATPAESMAVTLRADLPGEVEETTGQDADGVLDVGRPARRDRARRDDPHRRATGRRRGLGRRGVDDRARAARAVARRGGGVHRVGGPGPQPPGQGPAAAPPAAVTGGASPSVTVPSVVDETEVAIVGAGPAGLVLSHLLAARGIDCVVLEQRDRDYVEHRVRAGVLEHPTVELLRELGLADRLDREGLAHRGVAAGLRRAAATASTSST